MTQMQLGLDAPNQADYRVSLVDDGDNIFYDCQAESEAQAQAKAEKAYPGCLVLSLWKRD